MGRDPLRRLGSEISGSREKHPRAYMPASALYDRNFGGEFCVELVAFTDCSPFRPIMISVRDVTYCIVINLLRK